MPEPRLFFLGRSSCELPAGWRGLEADPDWGIEIVPGVRVALTGTGDFLLPDGRAVRGAGIAVWDNREEPAETEWGIRYPADNPEERVRNFGAEGEQAARMILPDHLRIYRGRAELVRREIGPWKRVDDD